MELSKLPLFRYLERTGPEYATRLGELRASVTAWLSYIPATFPHYTIHTVSHSDQVVEQVSKLLFADDAATPVVTMAPLEAYIICAAAYLHDAGMVMSEDEKRDLLGSKDWIDWVSLAGPAGGRWSQISALRSAASPDATIRNFLADVQTRFLIAEFVRKTHHMRSARFLTLNESLLSQFAFGDPALLRVIGDVCASHGLNADALLDRDRYPERTDLRGETVSVLFAALLLRLGDLLDLSTDRACPLLLNHACTLPADSLAHWTQYGRITHRLTAPDRIEITAECSTQEEHRLLQDWCSWLVREVDNAATLMSRSRRHQEWRPPVASLEGPNPTIKIRPATGATYRNVRWHFELDEGIVFERLINDLYDSPLAFVRELLQNAFDASRVRLYQDLEQAGEPRPVLPSRAPDAWLGRYPVRVTVADEAVRNGLSGELETRTCVTVEDFGVGMDEEIVRRYLLQIGRSFYTSAQFLRTSPFTPTSRFGLGFLSVFGVSDHVVVETLRPGSPDGPIRLTLSGPRNYLLVENGSRAVSGTSVTVSLRSVVAPSAVFSAIAEWCRCVEFPIEIVGGGQTRVLTREAQGKFEFDEPDRSADGFRLQLRAFPVEATGLDGTLYVFVRQSKDGVEDWTRKRWAVDTYRSLTPEALALEIPESMSCFHGIASDRRSLTLGRDAMIERLDFRGTGDSIPMGRHGRRRDSVERRTEITSQWVGIVTEHLRTSSHVRGAAGWEYLQAMARSFDRLGEFWDDVPGTIRVFQGGTAVLMSARQLSECPTITVVWEPHHWTQPDWDRLRQRRDQLAAELPSDYPTLTLYEVMWLADRHAGLVFRNRYVSQTSAIASDCVRLDWTLDPIETAARRIPFGYDGSMYLGNCGNLLDVGTQLHPIGDHGGGPVFLNRDSAFVSWLERVVRACAENEGGLNLAHRDQLLSLTADAARYGKWKALRVFLEAWKRIGNLPPELVPPRPFPDASSFRFATPAVLRWELGVASRRH